jgi:hypothetical protein
MPVAAFLGKISALLSNPLGKLIEPDGTVGQRCDQRMEIHEIFVP